MKLPGDRIALLTVPIRSEEDVVLTRQKARELAESLGFTGPLRTTVATAVSEIVRNAFRYAGGGTAEFAIVLQQPGTADRRQQHTFLIEVTDRGPGIPNLDDVLAGRYRSSSGLGLGLIGTRRLMDRVEISTSTTGTTGTTVAMAKTLPPSAALLSRRQIDEIVLANSTASQPAPLQEIQIQNTELLVAIDESHKKHDELLRINQELTETNAGVMALYDELETLNRISQMLASKLELKALIQSIIDVTTALTDAELGTFFFCEPPGHWPLYAIAGEEAAALSALPGFGERTLDGAEFQSDTAEHIPDLEAYTGPSVGARFAEFLGCIFPVQSCLSIPVVDARQGLIGAFIFASRRKNVFTERSERILTSVAAQTAVGVEKARLFQSVTAANDAKDQFFATLSHELRTPLNPALAIVSSLQNDPHLPPELRSDVGILARNIRLEARLIDDLLDFNRLIKGKLDLNTEVVDMHSVVASVLQICREDIQAKKQILEVHFDAANARVVGDEARLQQVLWNVLKNSIKFTPDGGRITLRTANSGDSVQVWVTDTGRGIASNALERIFGAFEQDKPSGHHHTGGLGLGLAIARMFVSLHHGRIQAQSEGVGHGTSILVELPTTNAPVRHISPPAPITIAGKPPTSTRHILLVDDHADTLQSLHRLLTRRGYQVTGASSGTEALATFSQHTFHLLITDLGLPDMSGWDLVKKIRASSSIPSIALSGYGMEADLSASKDAGFDVHMTKPIDFLKLVAAIEDLSAPRSLFR